MGRIKTQLTKRITNKLVAEHKTELTEEFETNKQKVAQLADIPSKKLRNIIAGYATRQMKHKEE